MSDQLLAAVGAGVDVVDLGRQLRVGMPQSPNHPQFWHTLPRRHGDMTRDDGASAANDMITMGTHVGTHIDALAHVSQDGRPARRAGRRRGRRRWQVRRARRAHHRADDPPRRTPRRRGSAGQRPAGRWLRDHRRGPRGRRAQRQGSPVRAGDVVLIRTGWGQALRGRCRRTPAPRAEYPGCPRTGRAGSPAAASMPPGPTPSPSSAWPPAAATRCCRRTGCSWSSTASTSSRRSTSRSWPTAGCHEFTFVLVPLNIFGATGSPVRPLAVTSA